MLEQCNYQKMCFFQYPNFPTILRHPTIWYLFCTTTRLYRHLQLASSFACNLLHHRKSLARNAFDQSCPELVSLFPLTQSLACQIHAEETVLVSKPATPIFVKHRGVQCLDCHASKVRKNEFQTDPPYFTRSRLNEHQLDFHKFTVCVDFSFYENSTETVVLTGGASYRWFTLRFQKTNQVADTLCLYLNQENLVYNCVLPISMASGNWHSIGVAVNMYDKQMNIALDGGSTFKIAVALPANLTSNVANTNYADFERHFHFAYHSSFEYFVGRVRNLAIINRFVDLQELCQRTTRMYE